MITFNDFTEEMCNDIKSAVKDCLLKLGVDVDVNISAETYSHRSEEYIVVETSEFNTTPVIYKSIYVRGSGTLQEVEGHEGVYDLYIPLGYYFKYFDGGSNGVSIGTMYFRVFAEGQRVAKVSFSI